MYVVLNICKHWRNLELSFLRLKRNIIWIWKQFLDLFFFILLFYICSVTFKCKKHIPKSFFGTFKFHRENILFNNVIFIATHDQCDCTIFLIGEEFQNHFFKIFKIFTRRQLKFAIIKYLLKFSCKLRQWSLIFS